MLCPRGPASHGVPPPRATFAAHRDVFLATICDVVCAGGWRGKTRHLESIHAAIASMNNAPLLDSSGLQVFSKDKPSFSIAGSLLSKCLKALLKTLGSRQPALQSTPRWGFKSAAAKSYVMGLSSRLCVVLASVGRCCPMVEGAL